MSVCLQLVSASLALEKTIMQVSRHNPSSLPATLSTQTESIIELEFDESNVQKLWTAEADSHTEFRYAHPQSSMQYVIKVSRMGIKTVILAMAIGVDRTVSLDIVTKDFTSAAFFPWTNGDRDVVQGFIGEHRVKELASLIKINILQK